MKTYQYQLLKYIHDHFTGEFVNVGVVIYSPEDRYLDCQVLRKYQRLTSFFPDANGRLLIRVLRNFESRINHVSKSLNELFKPSESLESITNNILPRDNSSLQLSQVKLALDVDLHAALDDLYNDLVVKYIPDAGANDSLNDEDVWKLKYKSHFEKYQLSSKLTTHNVRTKNDIFAFDKAWKNHIWHCYEPVSFALQNKESIKDKVYKWAGKIQGIQQANEKLHLTLLSSLNPKHRDLNSFIHSYLDLQSENLTVKIVLENEAEKTAKELHSKMLAHDEE
jgi:hypothetical protein